MAARTSPDIKKDTVVKHPVTKKGQKDRISTKKSSEKRAGPIDNNAGMDRSDEIEDDSVLTVNDDTEQADSSNTDSAVEKEGPKVSARPKGPPKKAEDSYAWQSAVSFNSMSLTTMLRELLEGMDASFKREKSEKSYSQLYAIVPFPRVAYVFRFIIEEPCELIIDIYEINPAISGSMTFMEIPALTDSNIHFARKLLRKLTEKLPRPPWKFTMAQRVQHGLLNLDILKARKNWMTIGIAR